MAQRVRNIRARKRNGKIKFKQTARIVEKNDATRVAKNSVDTIPKRKAPFIINDNGLNMRIKIKRK